MLRRSIFHWLTVNQVSHWTLSVGLAVRAPLSSHRRIMTAL